MVTKQQFTKANKERKQKLAEREMVTVEFLKNHFKSNNSFDFNEVVDDFLKVTKKLNKPTIHIVNIVDCSGSMGGKKIDAANEMVKSDINKVLNTTDVNYTYTLRTFDTSVDDYIFKLSKNPSLKKELKPKNLTALYDAIGITLNNLKEIPECDKVIVSIITDGAENASSRYTAKDVSRLIEELNNKNFTITFVGTQQDVENSINNLKIDRSNTQSYDGTGEGLKMSMTVRESSLNLYTKNVIAGKNVKKGFYKQVNK
jgi:uncharacterized protein YegL